MLFIVCVMFLSLLVRIVKLCISFVCMVILWWCGWFVGLCIGIDCILMLFEVICIVCGMMICVCMCDM